MTEVPSNPEFNARSATPIDTDLLNRLEMVKIFLENEGIDNEAIQASFGRDGLTVETLIDKAVSLFVKSFGDELAEESREED